MSNKTVFLRAAVAVCVCAVVFQVRVAAGATFALTADEAIAGPAEQLDVQRLPLKYEDGRTHVAVADMLFTPGRNGAITPANLWTGGKIYYVFQPSVSESQRQLWRAAAAAWSSAVDVLTFIEGTGNGNYIAVANSDRNNSYVGMIGGAQPMNIYSWSEKWVIAHEIGHALGMVHEHCRSDRDTYVKILWNNIISGEEFNFEKYPSRNYGSYDFESVMHYGRMTGSTNGQNTMEPQSNYQTYLYKMGNPTQLSSRDRSAVAQRYAPQTISPPAVINAAATSVTGTSAVINGVVVSNGGSAVDARHFFWGPESGIQGEVTEENITTSGDKFSATLTGLTPNTTYYFLAYAHNGSSLDMGYGQGWGTSDVPASFTTSAGNATLTVVASPTTGGTVTGGGTFATGSTQTISASPFPGWQFHSWNDNNTQSTRTVTVPSGGAWFTAHFFPLNLPAVETATAATVSSEAAVISGIITNEGGAPVDLRAFRWGTTTNPRQVAEDARVTVYGNRFSATIWGLEPGRTYYFRALAHNGSAADAGFGPGWRGGAVVSFTTRPATTVAAQPLNISTRLKVNAGEESLIGGFIISGDGAKKVIVRALGPSLQKSGVVGVLADPVLALRDASGSLITSNDSWQDTQQEAIVQSGVPPEDEREAAIVAMLPPGSYTAVLTGRRGTTGVGLLEVYDLNRKAGSRLANISTRGFVGTAADVMIGGFILGAQSAPAKIVIRALGPSLGAAGVNNPLADPALELYDSNGTLVRANNDWRGGEAEELDTIGVAPDDEREAAIVALLPRGAYTALVRGAEQNGTGVALMEVYHVQ